MCMKWIEKERLTMEADIHPRFESWARQRWDNAAMAITITRNGEIYYANYCVQCSWLAWREASEGERARVAACLV